MAGVFKLYGIRNHVAKKNITQMLKSDIALWYSSTMDKSVFGVMKVKGKAYQDTTTKEEWLAIDFVPVKTFRKSITLKDIKEDTLLKTSDIIKQKRISVVPIKLEEYKKILKIDKITSQDENNTK